MKWEVRDLSGDDSFKPGGRNKYPPRAHGLLYRAPVPGGWLVYVVAESSSAFGASASGGLTFVPDPTHSWDWSKDHPDD